MFRGRFWLPLLLAAGLIAAWAVAPGAVAGQEGEEGDPVEVENPIEWNFRPAAGDAAESDVSLQERWDAPFAVISSGRPAPREARRVVIPGAAGVARRTAAVAADSGETVAEVTLEAEEEERVAVGSGEGGTLEEEDGDFAAEDDDAGDQATAEEAAAAAASEPAEDTPSPSASEPDDGARTHRVRYGETWYGLARQYRVSSGALAAANPDVDPERLRAGTLLRLPADPAAPRRHTVSRGDTLFGIARRYGVSPQEIREANRLPNDVVKLGQTLVIPPQETSR